MASRSPARSCLIDGGVGGADEIEDGCAGFGGIQVVSEGGHVVGLRLFQRRPERGVVPGARLACVEALMEGPQALDGVGGFGKSVEGEVELMAVGHGDQREADGRGLVALEQQVAQGVEVALALRHLAAVDEQEAHVHPVAGEGLVRGGLALRDLVLVVREHQVFAAGVQVEAVAQVLHGHGGALDVPAGTAAADGRIP